MTQYQFRCKKCGHEFDKFLKINTKKKKVRCPYCKSYSTRKIIHAPKVIFKGAGWYINDSKDKK